MCKAGSKITIGRHQNKEVHPTSVWKVLIPRTSVGNTLLCPISAIALQSANPTEETLELTHHLLDYLGTQEEAVLTFNASEMVLAAHSNASYLSKTNA